MKVLVLNCGSSSVKFTAFDGLQALASGVVERIGYTSASISYKAGDISYKDAPEILDHRDAIRIAIKACCNSDRGGAFPSEESIEGVGHRVVHGGEKFSQPVLIDEEVIAAIEEHIPLAPLHNPANLTGIRIAREVLPNVPHVGVFDTAFHQSMPPEAYMYALPYKLYSRHKVRRYGFHGTSHRYVDERVRDLLGDLPDARVITCHLGNGSSMAAIRGGKVQDTSMGMTPLEGLVMGTRCGDLDPSVVLYSMAEEGLSPTQVNAMLNKHSGLYGLSGISGDMRELEEASGGGNARARLAVDVFCYRIRKYLGAYAAALGGLNAVVFTGGIGENSARVRRRCTVGLGFLGFALDPKANEVRSSEERRVDDGQGPVQVWVIPTDEELIIARSTIELGASQK
jgi:acetate kinase